MKINQLLVLVLSVFMCIYTLNACTDSAAQGSEIPYEDDEELVNNEIDYFILEKLENNHVKPKPTADDESLRFS